MNRLNFDDFTRIIKAVSASPAQRHLVLLTEWVDYIIQNSDHMSQANIDDIEVALTNIDFKQPDLIDLI